MSDKLEDVGAIKKGYNSTPLPQKRSEEELRRLRSRVIPSEAIYPKTYQKGQQDVKTNYFKPPAQNREPRRNVYDRPSFAEELIARVPHSLNPGAIRSFWEKELLSAYYHLYGGQWAKWALIIPWVKKRDTKAKAESFGCEQPWSWIAKQRFLEEHDFHWNMEDLDYLISWYPDRQNNDSEQGIFVQNKSFYEILSVARELGLPNREVISALAKYAKKLNK